ncbi:hypothetical protein NVV94_09075 [Pseudomonas sp. LS1212]|uniref:hypothetical protein n=1 Tax=Pseudomonas sp. LS1212 TaxID=2972478 RepID=UPI00215C69AE|nr:hypothetical protein [Pseudomonas sp. LS1212]UVJ45680.1 hypothetical protein NVV94_09075 [Pseudomonas sp. LS1212]
MLKAVFKHLSKFSLAAMVLALAGCYPHHYDRDDDGWRDRDHRHHSRYDRRDRYDRDDRYERHDRYDRRDRRDRDDDDDDDDD